MFGIIVIVAVVAVGGYIGISEMNKTTGEKVKAGDSVFVPLDQISALNPVDGAPLGAFLKGFTSMVAKVTNVIPGATHELMTGNIIGFPGGVSFPRQSVASIDRNGTRIV